MLVARVIEGETEAFSELVRRHQGAIYACAWQILRDPVDAEEAAQEAFVQAFMKLEKLRQPKYFFTWVWRICTTVSSRWRRKTSRLNTTPSTNRAMAPVRSTASELAERDSTVLRALDLLPKDQRQILLLRFWQEMDYPAISELLGVSEEALYQRVSRGLKKLRGLLGADFLNGEVSIAPEPAGPASSRVIFGPEEK